MSMLKHESVKNAVSADVGALALSLSDASLYSWAEICVGYYQEILSVDFKRLAS